MAKVYPPDDPQPRPRGGCLSSLLWGVMLLAGSWIYFGVFHEPVREYIAAFSWRETPCTIVRSEVTQRPEAEGLANIVYSAAIEYEYKGRERTFRGKRIWFMDTGPDSEADARALVGRYPQGSRHTCFVEPNRPSNAILDRSLRPRLLVALIPLLLGIVSALALLSRLIHTIRPPHSSTPAPMLPKPTRDKVTTPGTPVTRRGRSGIGITFFFLLMAGFWNFVVSFLVREVIDNWKDGFPGCHGLFITLFAVPFVAVGVALVGMTLYSFLKIFNPRPTVAFSSGAARLGESIEIAWRFTGRYDRISRLRILLEGKEEATYVRGTTTTTDRETFLTLTLIDVNRTSDIRFGKATLQVPLDTSPTFSSANNKIRWVVRVIGQIRRWPDVNDEFDLHVLPMPAASQKEA